MEENEARLLEELRRPQLPRAVRGYQEDATESLLERAAAALDRGARERDLLRERAVRAPQPDGAQEPDAETIGQALATATALGDRIVAEANERAEAMRTEAAAEATRLLAGARGEMDEELARARAEVARLQGEVEELRSYLETQTKDFVAAARVALEHLDELDAAADASSQPARGVFSDLQPSAAAPDAAVSQRPE